MRILALNVAHDSSVCSINDGKVEFFCKEERLSKTKRDRHPIKSIEKFASLNLGEIDSVVYSVPSNHESQVEGFFLNYINKRFDLKLSQFSTYPHHLCHAALAFYNSGFDRCLVVVIDRDGSVFVSNGEPLARESESVILYDRNSDPIFLHKSFWLMCDVKRKREVKEKLINRFSNCNVDVNNSYSLVKVYEAATTLIGQNPLENGKTMGLSSYGEDISEPLFLDGIPISDKLSHTDGGAVCFYGSEHLITRNVNKENYKLYADRAKQVQLQTQQVALNLIKRYVEQTGIKNVCLVGGYALNIVANNFYIKSLPEVNFYFEPTADDTGISIGAAMLEYKNITKKDPDRLTDNFFHYYEDEELNLGKRSSIEEVCQLLIDQKSVAIFEGSPEVGPRALGHRSILFDARNPDAKEIVNKIKKREWYRPFAGVILEEELGNYFHNLNIKSSPYMTINFDAKENTKELVPGIIHVDGTCRIQTVNTGFLYNLLSHFYNKTDCPIIMNTSFNLAGSPLVQTKQDAIETLRNSGLDAIYFVETQTLVTKDNL